MFYKKEVFLSNLEETCPMTCILGMYSYFSFNHAHSIVESFHTFSVLGTVPGARYIAIKKSKSQPSQRPNCVEQRLGSQLVK